MSTSARRQDSEVRLIRPPDERFDLALRELWDYRDLIIYLARRDVALRYKQTLLGGAWAILQPLLTMVVFSIFFGRLAGVPSDDLPYPLFAYAGLVLWTFFANGLSLAANSLVGSANLLRKVYFPRLAIPIAALLAVIPDLGAAFLVLLGMMAFFGVPLDPARVLALPAFATLAFVSALGLGLWLAALNVEYRDVRYAVPFFIQLLLFLTPIAYPASLVPDNWQLVYAANPLVSAVGGFRWALVGGRPPGPQEIAASWAVALVVLASGAAYFRRLERRFADVV